MSYAPSRSGDSKDAQQTGWNRRTRLRRGPRLGFILSQRSKTTIFTICYNSKEHHGFQVQCVFSSVARAYNSDEDVLCQYISLGPYLGR